MKTNNSYKHKRIGGRKEKLRLAHHLIWEAINGPIPEKCLIHHKDHNKQNNDIENLQLVTELEHQRLHSSFMGILNGEWLRVCKYCRNISSLTKYPICDPCRARMARIDRRRVK